ncbi:GrpB family protein [Curvivirga sp.]|uniref:GrpB family protein n=1 Tax=Curvivirga sp. TaxID=2856848 RepID=UPI003B5BCACB
MEYSEVSNITIEMYNPDWRDAFERECDSLKGGISDSSLVLHHIGSTAVSGIYAKPIIDILGVVEDFDKLDSQKAQFERIGYEVMGAFGIEARRYYRKITADGVRTHHLHIFLQGSEHIDRHLAFRDYLRLHPAVAKEYSDLKLKLLDKKDLSWDSYIDGKESFVQRTEEKALDWYLATKC